MNTPVYVVAARDTTHAAEIAAFLPAESALFTEGAALRDADISGAKAAVISTPLSDESGPDLAAFLSRKTSLAVILLTKNEVAADIAHRLRFAEVAVLPRPVSRSTLNAAIDTSVMFRAATEKLRRDLALANKQLDEQKQVFRAKACLMEHHGLTEDEAHGKLRREAMDRRLTLAEVAVEVINDFR
ncbi:MAG: ANTAR domain-containing protein [Oscillospiraceae bacterium]|nr:ANTAR domain-containing protein [Oscillospiraceae bacterium]